MASQIPKKFEKACVSADLSINVKIKIEKDRFITLFYTKIYTFLVCKSLDYIYIYISDEFW